MNCQVEFITNFNNIDYFEDIVDLKKLLAMENIKQVLITVSNVEAKINLIQLINDKKLSKKLWCYK